jgi:hypothetical protein
MQQIAMPNVPSIIMFSSLLRIVSLLVFVWIRSYLCTCLVAFKEKFFFCSLTLFFLVYLKYLFVSYYSIFPTEFASINPRLPNVSRQSLPLRSSTKVQGARGV